MEGFTKQRGAKSPLILLTINGWGVSALTEANVFKLVDLPYTKKILQNYPSTVLEAGSSVLSDYADTIIDRNTGQAVINVGHRLVPNHKLLEHAIVQGAWYRDAQLLQAVRRLKQSGAALRLVGYLDRNPNEWLGLKASLEIAKRKKISRVYAYIILNSESEADCVATIKDLEALQSDYQDLVLVCLLGSEYGLNCRGDWKKTEKAWRCLSLAEGHQAKNPYKSLKKVYERGLSGPALTPTCFLPEADELKLSAGDSLIWFNDQTAPLYQLASVTADKFSKFNRKLPSDLYQVSIGRFPKGLPIKQMLAKHRQLGLLGALRQHQLQSRLITDSLGYLSLAIGLEIVPAEAYDDLNIVSAPADFLEPSSLKKQIDNIINEAVKQINSQKFDYLRIDIPQLDLVASTGQIDLTKQVWEHLDRSLERLVKAVLDNDNLLLISSVCAHVEMMYDIGTGSVNKVNTNNPVPLIIIGNHLEGHSLNWSDPGNGDLSLLVPSGSLLDLAPTILSYFKIEPPKTMAGKNLL